LARADIAATHAVDAIVRQTLPLVDARDAIVLLADTLTIARSAPALFVGIFVVGNVTARSVGPAAFFRRRASLTRAQAPTVATYAVGAISRLALRGRRARGTIGILGLRTRITRSRAIAFARIALVVGIRARRNIAANSIGPAAFFRRRASLTRTHADIAAAIPIDAIVGQTVRRRRASKTIVVFALVLPVASAIRAIIVGIGIVFDRSAYAIDATALFRCAAGHAFVVAFAIATKTINAITRRALRAQRARRCIPNRRNELRRLRGLIPTRIMNRIRWIRIVQIAHCPFDTRISTLTRAIEVLCAASRDDR